MPISRLVGHQSIEAGLVTASAPGPSLAKIVRDIILLAALLTLVIVKGHTCKTQAGLVLL